MKLIPQPYPPQKGGAAMRMFEQIKYFGSRHQLTVVSFIFNEADYEIEAQLAPYCDRAFMVKLGMQMSPYRENIQHQAIAFIWLGTGDRNFHKRSN